MKWLICLRVAGKQNAFFKKDPKNATSKISPVISGYNLAD